MASDWPLGFACEQAPYFRSYKAECATDTAIGKYDYCKSAAAALGLTSGVIQAGGVIKLGYPGGCVVDDGRVYFVEYGTDPAELWPSDGFLCGGPTAEAL